MAPKAAESGWQGMAQHRGPWARLLWPLSLLYGALVRWRLHSAPSQRGAPRLPLPVIVIGNVVVGGAGKTPTTMAVVRHLSRQGWTPGVVSRGHGRRDQSPASVELASDPLAVGDEPLLIRRSTGVPVWVGRQRVDAARALLAAHPLTDVLVCDDGLQHLPLHGDLRIAVFDDRGLGNGWLLPAGLLREPWPIRPPTRAPQLVLIHGQPFDASALPMPNGTDVFFAQRELATVAVDALGASRPLAELQDQPVLAVAAIARPERFFEMLTVLGVPIARSVALPDHASASVIEAAIDAWHGHVLCTEKDLVKLGGASQGASVWAVPLKVDIDAGFFDAIDRALNGLRS
ncbi:MAG: tetraacyldisaccharide 4'-kinase [Hydrogenophaga sp.]|uniref:tetraacyldisaccharide 4'-kinase n=1 Tax=Hydrogenophaga sp. TaxID=1904254 RepID=UPI001D4A4D31|nr:tetraacyldisaccharide 4'-kinase [Hydrogenophaga sp.]MBX3610228.1 tetraacyldisaccharide 4'-kinase [Hydrogenophaga sp.]